MRLEDEPSSLGTGSAAGPPSVRLTQDELTALLNEAISRHSEAERRAETVATLDDALDIARQLAIPEEHVRAAAGELQRRRTRELRRVVVRQRRKTAFLAALGIAAAIGVVVLLVQPSLGGVISALIAALPALYLGFRVAAPVSDEEADRVELPPVPGQCRVCGSKATTARSTFCADHQYQTPGA
jgi:hypothetical protein